MISAAILFVRGSKQTGRADMDMGFTEAVGTCFAKYATFSGRAVRSEFWYWVLFTVIASIVLVLIPLPLIGSLNGSETLGWAFDLATILPYIAVTARRLHDVDRSGWWQLLIFVPVVGTYILLVWLCKPGTAGANRFG